MIETCHWVSLEVGEVGRERKGEEEERVESKEEEDCILA